MMCSEKIVYNLILTAFAALCIFLIAENDKTWFCVAPDQDREIQIVALCKKEVEEARHWVYTYNDYYNECMRNTCQYESELITTYRQQYRFYRGMFHSKCPQTEER